jgi:uncharacterized protein (TIGR03435 family)
MRYLALAAIGMAFAQSPTFDVASVKPFHDDGVSVRNSPVYSPQGVTCAGCNPVLLIAEAYKTTGGRIVGPASLTKEELWAPLTKGYDIEAKTDHPVSKDEIRVMLQSLLTERFHLAFHRETKTVRAYRLAPAAGGPKLEESPDASGPFSMVSGPDGYVFRNAAMARLSGLLSSLLDQTAVDETGLKGIYNFTLRMPPDWRTNQPAKSAGPSPDSLTSGAFGDALKRLGLQLTLGTVALEYFVVDHVERPTEN